ncbi:MAG: isoprenylcysteine carboxylmethyltransferase family protein [Dehalococcoidia bacterium]|nr:MAG: isoprenylcysteine carboxylmethyltransferase family protein [Dehalococcoidia bacterium]
MEGNVRRGVIKGAVKAAIFYIIIAAILFTVPGKLDWWMAWVFLAVFIASYIVDLIILDPELLAERSGVKEGNRKYDIILAMFMAWIGTFIVVLIAALDKRFGWSPIVPFWLQILGLLLIVLGSILITWAMASNKFFSGVVRIQTDRGHTVSSMGPYRFLRHPGYLGAGLTYLGTPFTLGSLWAFVPVFLVIVDIVVRTALEDGVLRRDLSGYIEYAGRVKYRLLPGIW